jgi:hypothetical protein
VTGGEFSEVDIDLLADYVGGALDGTPDETVVAGLVADDPAWRTAHDALAGATATVGAQLRLLGAAPAPMPADVAARLDAALAGLPPLTAAADAGAPAGAGAATHRPEVGAATHRPDTGAATHPPHAGAAIHPPHAGAAAHRSGSGSTGARRHLAAVPGEARSGRQQPATSGRRAAMRRWSAPIAVAAGVLAFAGIGLAELLSGGDQPAGTATSAGEQATPLSKSQDSAAAGFATEQAAERVTASGINYRRESLQSAARAAASPAPQGAKVERSSPQESLLDTQSVVPALQRLSVREALIACIEAIAAEHGAGPVSVESADYARFEGSPALVVRFTASNGTWAWVSGPDCGAPGAAADTHHRVQVG